MGDEDAVTWLRAKKAAAIIGVSRWTVARNAEQWKLRTRAFPRGRTGEIRYHAGDVAALVRRMDAGEFRPGTEES